MEQQKQDRLLAQLADYGSCLVAFSGGVDSAVVALAAHRALGPHALAVTARSASVPAGEVAAARHVAEWIGIRHLVVATAEGTRPDYRRNDARRCYYCKDELYARLRPLADERRLAVIANGTNADDLADFRPWPGSCPSLVGPQSLGGMRILARPKFAPLPVSGSYPSPTNRHHLVWPAGLRTARRSRRNG